MELSLDAAEQVPQDDTMSSPVSLEWCSGVLHGKPIHESFKTIRDLQQVFRDHAALATMEASLEVYRVRWWAPVQVGTEGGLLWGVTVLQPGKVGNEFFMTRGHFHANRTRAEYYGTVSGDGMLIQMNADRHTWVEVMKQGSLHYVRGENAHRIANTGNTPLVVWACWPSDAGYDYGTIAERGFSARLVEQDGMPVLVRGE